MRIPKSLSYSSLSLWEKDIDEFYAKYLSDHAAPRLPQTPPMAVGSAFDAEVKAALHAALFGARIRISSSRRSLRAKSSRRTETSPWQQLAVRSTQPLHAGCLCYIDVPVLSQSGRR